MSLFQSRKGRIVFECLMLAAVLAMSPWLITDNSPLYQNVNPDNAIFLSIGKGITQGKTPYVDLTENKGPLFFALMAIPQLFAPGTTSVYVLEALMLAAYCWMLMRIARWMLGENAHPLAVLLPVMWCVYYYNGQNFCEEYDLFFTTIGVGVLLNAYTGQTDGEKWRSFVLGAVTACVALIKLSDILALGVTVLFYIVYVLRSGKRFWKEAGRFWLGMAAVALPVFVWLGCMGAIGPMLEEYLLNNFVHIAKGKNVGFMESRRYIFEQYYGLASVLPVKRMIKALIIAVVLCPREHRKTEWRIWLYSAALAAANWLIAFVAGSGFMQHLTLGQLTEVLAMLLVLRTAALWLKKWPWARNLLRGKYLVALAACCLFAYQWIPTIDTENYLWQEKRQWFREYVTEFQEAIQDYETVYMLGYSPLWFWENDIFPAYKYYNLCGFIQDNVGIGLAEDFEAFLMENPIEAIVIGDEIETYRGILTDATVEFMHNHYYIDSTNSDGYLKLLLLI